MLYEEDLKKTYHIWSISFWWFWHKSPKQFPTRGCRTSVITAAAVVVPRISWRLPYKDISESIRNLHINYNSYQRVPTHKHVRMSSCILCNYFVSTSTNLVTTASISLEVNTGIVYQAKQTSWHNTENTFTYCTFLPQIPHVH